MALVNINGVLVNPAVAKMYGIPYHKLTKQQKKVLHADSVRRAKENAAREKAVLKNNLKAFTDEKKMESVLAQIYQGCQKQILADVAKTMAEVQKAGGTWSYANQSALTRSKGLFYQIEEELKKLGVAQTNTMYSGLGNIYTDQFLRTTFELGQTLPMPATVNFTKLNPALVRRTLDYPWSGELFSDRIWADKAKLGRSLRVNLTASMVLGEDMRRISERINKNVQESENAAMRLARTETKRVVYVAHDDVYEEFGVDELEYRCANGIDNRTCKVCKQFNGTVYKRGQEIPLPVHPNCRCVYIPVVADTFKPGELNELTHDTRGAENYEKWVNKQKEEAEAARDSRADETSKAVGDITTQRKATQNKLDNRQKDLSSLEDDYDNRAVVRRGLMTPEEAGYKNQADFDLQDKQLSAEIDKVKAEIESLRVDVIDHDLDISFVTGNNNGVANLSLFQDMRKMLRADSSFDYLGNKDDILAAAIKMDTEAITEASKAKPIAKVFKGKPMSVEKADNGRVNPNYSLGGGYRTNCQSSVVTYEARLRGYDVEVLANTSGSTLETLSYNTNLAWIDPKTGEVAHYTFTTASHDDILKVIRGEKVERYTAAKLEKLLQDNLVEGRRYNIGFQWAGRGHGGHIVCIDKQKGVLHIYDPQTNRNFYGDEVSQYLTRFKYKKSFHGKSVPSPIEIMRVDDKIFNSKIVDNILKGAK